MSKARGTARNGSRVHVEFPDYSGLAHVIERGGLTYVSYRPDELLPVETTINLHGQTRTIIAVKDDTMNEGFRTITLRKEP